ncbi:MAG: hypothetical protein F6K24_32920, partial [Okeania sp. SIO2D1]|nr:hypothetical protein [Okeania sp. SIO2D1]
CKCILKKRLHKALPYDGYILAFDIFMEFLEKHNVTYLIPRNLENYGRSNYQKTKAIVDFFEQVKNKIQSLKLNEQLQLRKKTINPLWQENNSSRTTELSSERNSNDAILEEKNNRISRLESMIEKVLQCPSFYINNQIQEVNQMTNNPGGFSVGGSVGGDITQGDKKRATKADHNKGVVGDIGDNSQVTQNQGTPSTEEPLTKEQIIQLLAELENLVKEAEIPEETKEEAAMYLGAAKKATQKEEPKKNTILTNLESVAETLETAGKTVDAGKSLWDKAKPIILKVAGWLGAAASFHLLGL